MFVYDDMFMLYIIFLLFYVFHVCYLSLYVLKLVHSCLADEIRNLNGIVLSKKIIKKNISMLRSKKVKKRSPEKSFPLI